jgi:hypothetical protein
VVVVVEVLVVVEEVVVAGSVVVVVVVTGIVDGTSASAVALGGAGEPMVASLRLEATPSPTDWVVAVQAAATSDEATPITISRSRRASSCLYDTTS